MTTAEKVAQELGITITYLTNDLYMLERRGHVLNVSNTAESMINEIGLVPVWRALLSTREKLEKSTKERYELQKEVDMCREKWDEHTELSVKWCKAEQEQRERAKQAEAELAAMRERLTSHCNPECLAMVLPAPPAEHAQEQSR